MNNDKSFVTTSIEVEIPFYDVDSMDITWHGNYLKYFEMARCALLDKINFGYLEMKASGYAWPVVDIRVKYIKPTKFKQKIIVEAFLVEYENRLKINYLIKDKQTQEKLTTGYSIQVAVVPETEEMCFVSPEVLLEKLKDFI